MAKAATVPAIITDEDEFDSADRQLELYLAIHTLRGMISKAHHGEGFNRDDMVGVDWLAGKALELAAGGLL
jgi:hypothetical protein